MKFRALFPFGGSGGGALGFLGAEARLLEHTGRFEALGSIDFDAGACEDFERFTGAPAWCADVESITAAEVRERYGATAPDVVFMSPPCKGSSRLLSSAKAATAKYQRMNALALVWTRVMLEAWGDDPPALVLLENVPGLPVRAAKMLRELRATLRRAGYVFHASTHDCGELGGLAQHRQRYLLVARHPKKCPSLLYQPPKKHDDRDRTPTRASRARRAPRPPEGLGMALEPLGRSVAAPGHTGRLERRAAPPRGPAVTLGPMRVRRGPCGGSFRRMGRPRNPTSSDRRVQILLRSMDERRVIEAAADAAGLPVSTWARRALLEAAGRPDLLFFENLC